MENLPSHQYTIVPLLGDEKSHGDSLEESRILPCQHCCRKNTSFWGSCLDVGVTYLGWIIAVVLATTLSISWWSWSSRIDRICLEYTSYHSPALKEIPIAYKEVRFNGSLDFPSIYRGPPSPEVDKAWKRVSELRAINVPISEPALRNLGVDVDSTVILPPEAGGGYMLDLEFPHQLHCLNLLRKVSHWDYYKDIDISFSQKPSVFRMHIDHCIEMLRQVIMCHADVGVLTNHYIKQRALPWPDFNTPHVCRDFDAIYDWTIHNQVPNFWPYPPRKPEGAKALAHPP